MSASQELGMGMLEPAATVHPDHDMLPATANAPAGLILVSRVADIPASLLALMLSSSAPPRSLTTGLVSPRNEVSRFICFSKFYYNLTSFSSFLIF